MVHVVATGCRAGMSVLLLTLMLAQVVPCEGGGEAIAAAESRLEAFDPAGALERLEADPPDRCIDLQIALAYLRGLAAAREAYALGGSPESLEPAHAAISVLVSLTAASQSAEAARILVLAAVAAAQSEREEMSLLLDHAVALEGRQRAAGERGAPLVSAHEAAGDLWLQVHRFEEARDAYRRAAKEVGFTRRVTIGLARSAARLADVPTACRQYQALVDGWRGRRGTPPEIGEALAYLAQPSCARPSQPRRR